MTIDGRKRVARCRGLLRQLAALDDDDLACAMIEIELARVEAALRPHEFEQLAVWMEREIAEIDAELSKAQGSRDECARSGGWTRTPAAPRCGKLRFQEDDDGQTVMCGCDSSAVIIPVIVLLEPRRLRMRPRSTDQRSQRAIPHHHGTVRTVGAHDGGRSEPEDHPRGERRVGRPGDDEGCGVSCCRAVRTKA
jgi:hypothetical protein